MNLPVLIEQTLADRGNAVVVLTDPGNGEKALILSLLVAGFQPRPARWNVNGPSKMRGRNVDVAIR